LAYCETENVTAPLNNIWRPKAIIRDAIITSNNKDGRCPEHGEKLKSAPRIEESIQINSY
jgi:hypothetical protein